MCGLCGDLAGLPDWMEAVGADPVERRRHRAARLRAARALLGVRGLTLTDWEGRYVLGTGRGRAEVLGDLRAVWEAAERLTGAPVDPLCDEGGAALEALRA